MELIKIFFLSAVPLIEQRGAIPVGILVYGISPMVTFLVSLVGSLLPAPFILLFFNVVYKWMQNIKAFDWFTGFIEKKLRKNTPQLEKYKEVGLITFIAIPLPTTGIWTGCAVAAFLGLDFKKSMLCAFAGGVLSALAITVLTVAFPALLGLH